MRLRSEEEGRRNTHNTHTNKVFRCKTKLIKSKEYLITVGIILIG